jgi:two-component system nitrate/nitrite response regulator NarL
MAAPTKKLLIMADDHPRIREILGDLLAEHHESATLYTADNPRDLLALADSRLAEADVLTVADISLAAAPAPDTGAPPLTQREPKQPLMVVSLQERGITANWFVSIEAGADDNDDTRIEAALDQRTIVMELIRGLRTPVDSMGSDPIQDVPSTEALMGLGLTRRQAEVLSLLAEGLSNKEIARQLDVSEWTVRHHVSAILARLEVNNRGRAAMYARQLGA